MLECSVKDSVIHLETNALHVRLRTEGYVSGVAAGGLVDKKTERNDLGFGLHIADFLMQPADPNANVPPGQYRYGEQLPLHGDIPKRYVEGPQICTKARKLPYEIVRGQGFVAIKLWYTFTKAYGDFKSGSQWEQTLVFTENERYFLSADRITTVNECENQFFRIDMPGHIKHHRGNNFEHIYLSYEGAMLPSTDFLLDFAPDEKYFYQRGKQKLPKRFIRAYQVLSDGEPGPWLAGMTLNPADVYEAWCHQRGYVCMIQEIGGRPTQPGETFGAAYVVGWADSINELESIYDQYQGWSGIEIEGPEADPTGFDGLKADELPPVNRPIA